MQNHVIDTDDMSMTWFTGLDSGVPDLDGPEHTFIEANDRPGLVNHQPQPTAERSIDLLFPETACR